ncbi:MAG: MarR family transcriptional regulator [Candidatus Acidiferrales bacterium]
MKSKRNARESVDYRALAGLRFQIRRFLIFSEQAAQNAGLEPQQHQALLALKGLPADREPTVRALAERLQTQHHSAVELLDRLERRGLARRTRSRSDRREVLLHVTRAGEAILHKLTATHTAELRTAGPALLRALKAAMRHSARGRGRAYSSRGDSLRTHGR